MTERTYAEIDLGVIRMNYRIYRSCLLPHQRVMAVVKSNAYGHGATEVARALTEEGCSDFAVATLDEGIELREAGVEGAVLILGYTPPERLHEAEKHRLMQTVIDSGYADMVLYTAPDLGVQLAVDTGMRRAGFIPRDARLFEYARRLNVKGIYTHLAAADDERERDFTLLQLSEFEKACAALPHSPEYVHALNSAGGILFNTGATSHVRLGIMLYGISPSESTHLPEGMRPALRWYATLSSVRWIEMGESVGYGRAFVAGRRTRVGTVEVGYADGYRRALSDVGRVAVGGRTAPIVGRICMDRLTVDLTDAPEAEAGAAITLIGNGYGARDMADGAGTIPYEILTGISPRVKKRYIS